MPHKALRGALPSQRAFTWPEHQVHVTRCGRPSPRRIGRQAKPTLPSGATVSEFPDSGEIPVVLSVTANPNGRNEGRIAYEAGYRTTVLRRRFDRLRHLPQQTTVINTQNEPSIPPPQPPHLVLPLTFENLMPGETRGIEVAVNWQLTHRRTLSPENALEQIHIHLAPTNHDTTSVGVAEGSSPDIRPSFNRTWFCGTASAGIHPYILSGASPNRANIRIRGSTRDSRCTLAKAPP